MATQQQIQLLHLQQNNQNAAVIAMMVYRRLRRRRRRQYWIRPWISRRPQFGDFENLMAELERESHGDFIAYLRMEPAMFHELVQRLTPRLTKKDTNWRRCLSPGLKLAVTLRYLATGNSYHSLAFAFRVAHNTISKVVREVCGAIVEEYSDEVVKTPSTPDEWRQLSERFESRWNFPHAVGAIDGKHVAIRAPSNSGSLYYNYKGFFSIILLGVVDADYRFIWADIGSNGSASDYAVFNRSNLKAALDAGSIGFPQDEPLPKDDEPMPYFLVGDDAFPLRTWLMKPFSTRNLTEADRVFNYRLSRARRIVENAFGILANRFRCLLTTMLQEPDTVSVITSACICLHNLMRIRYPGLQNALVDREDVDHQVVPGAWRDECVFEDVRNVTGPNVATREAKRKRIYYKHYVNSIGAVPWQRNMI